METSATGLKHFAQIFYKNFINLRWLNQDDTRSFSVFAHDMSRQTTPHYLIFKTDHYPNNTWITKKISKNNTSNKEMACKRTSSLYSPTSKNQTIDFHLKKQFVEPQIMPSLRASGFCLMALQFRWTAVPKRSGRGLDNQLERSISVETVVGPQITSVLLQLLE